MYYNQCRMCIAVDEYSNNSRSLSRILEQKILGSWKNKILYLFLLTIEIYVVSGFFFFKNWILINWQILTFPELLESIIFIEKNDRKNVDSSGDLDYIHYESSALCTAVPAAGTTAGNISYISTILLKFKRQP